MPSSVGRETVRILAGSPYIRLVEVLGHDEYTWAHLPGAINIPLRDLDQRASGLDRQVPVVVYCHDLL